MSHPITFLKTDLKKNTWLLCHILFSDKYVCRSAHYHILQNFSKRNCFMLNASLTNIEQSTYGVLREFYYLFLKIMPK